ncbi:MAG TPA: hypothetical protein VFM60_06595 [Salinimicrobium sp.]|nr:hypothetical protein [Salinimicrobium sp.]
MTKLFFFSFLFFGCLPGFSQQSDRHREKIEALKTAYITEGLDLSPEEAQIFWPIYNEYTEKRRDLYRKEYADIEKLECISEDEANSMLEEYVSLERKDYLLKKNFYQDLRKLFSAKEIIKLKKVEDDFNRKMIKEYRERHSKSPKEGS